MDNVTMIDMQPVPFGLVLLKYLHTPHRVAPFLAWAKRLGDDYDETSRWKVGRCQTTDSILFQAPV